MSNNMAKIADARKTVEQLKLEVNIERMMVSEERPRVSWFNGAISTIDTLFPCRCPRPQRI